MRITRLNIIIALMVFVLGGSSQACLLEQAITLVADWAPHSHDSAEPHKHNGTSPSHHHDDAGQTPDFCCVSVFSLFARSNDFANHHPVKYSILSNFLSNDAPTTIGSTVSHLHAIGLIQPSPFRTRDKYALSCLLHAPPHA